MLPFWLSKMEFISIGKVYTSLLKHLVGQALSGAGGGGGATYEKELICIYPFECSMSGFIELHILKSWRETSNKILNFW